MPYSSSWDPQRPPTSPLCQDPPRRLPKSRPAISAIGGLSAGSPHKWHLGSEIPCQPPTLPLVNCHKRQTGISNIGSERSPTRFRHRVLGRRGQTSGARGLERDSFLDLYVTEILQTFISGMISRMHRCRVAWDYVPAWDAQAVGSMRVNGVKVQYTVPNRSRTLAKVRSRAPAVAPR